MKGHILVLDESVFPAVMKGSTHIINTLPQRLLVQSEIVIVVREDGTFWIGKDRHGDANTIAQKLQEVAQ